MEVFEFEVNGAIDHYGYQRSNIKYYLNKNKEKEVRCKINSPGGSVNEAIAISKLFAEHGNVTVEFIGFCASCVTFMAFGAKKIIAFEDTLWLCHKCMVPVEVYKMMNSDEVDDFIKKLESNKKSQEAIDTIIASKYFERCSSKGKTMKNVVDLMAEEKWITSAEALEWGFIDEVQKGNKVVNEMRDFMVMNCAEFKLPVLPTAQAPEGDEAPKTNALLECLTNLGNMLAKVLPHNTKPNDVEGKVETNPKDDSQTQTQISMNKTFIAVNTILGIEGLTENNGKVEMTAEQLQKINDAIANSQAQKTELDNAVAALDAISDNVKNIEGITNKVNAVKMVVNMVPTGMPAGASASKGGEVPKNFDDCTDGVNGYVRGEE